MEGFKSTKAEERQRETGNLRAFIKEFVKPEAGGFVVAEDLMKGYTSWRQQRQPTMQLHYLYQAETDVTDLMKAYEWHTTLVVNDGQQDGTVYRAWKGAAFTLPGGNVTKPTPLPAAPLVEDVVEEEEEGPAPAAAAAAATTYCFHYRGAYDREPLNAFLRTRAFPAPADAEALDAKLAASVEGMGAALKGLGTPWTMRTVQHEGLHFNVYLAGAAGEGGGAGDGDRDVQ